VATGEILDNSAKKAYKEIDGAAF